MPLFSGIGVLTLAVGIGANTAVFSVIQGILLKPLPYPRSDELVTIDHAAPGINLPSAGAAPFLYFTYREQGTNVSGCRAVEHRHGERHRARGLAAAFGIMRLMTSLLFEVNPVDPMTYAMVSLMLIVAAALASYVPAVRASTVDPLVALRAE